jgi:uracil-DNA glycosylase
MLIGKDPTIQRRPERVVQAFMLNDPNQRLPRWIRDDVIGDALDRVTVYATNAVKCRLQSVPQGESGKDVLTRSFENCREYFRTEVTRFKPNVLVTFGEPCLRLFAVELASPALQSKMREDFTGCLRDASLAGVSFKYSPCPHMNTVARHAHAYRQKLERLKVELGKALNEKY